MRRVDRRSMLKMGAAAGAGMALGGMGLPTSAQSQRLSVLSTATSNPRPPGVDNFAVDLLTTWQTDHDTGVDYETHPFFEIDSVSRSVFESGQYVHDVFYNWAMVPEFAGNLLELGSRLPADLLSDLAPSQAASVSWQGAQYGVVPTLSLMLLFYNRDICSAAGVPDPPATWDELKQVAASISDEHPFSLLMPYGASAGIGGVTSVWSAFLQQAGGRMYDDDGTPVFNDAPGVDALQLMIDLMPYTAEESLGSAAYIETSYHMSLGRAAMTFSFPAFWEVLNADAPIGEGKIVPAVMPRGPESNATINGVDAWTIASASPNPDLSQQLIEFYLSPEVQKRQALDTGWLPARLSTLSDSDVQQANPVAAVLLEQAKAPFDSFVTRNYMAITDTIGREIQKALRGEQSASQALTAADAAIRPLIG